MKVNIFTILFVYCTILKGNFILSIINWIPDTKFLKKFALEVFFVYSFDHEFPLNRKELLGITVKVFLNNS